MSSSSSTNITLSEPSTVPHPEPGPDWKVAKQLWGIAWEIHWAGFGVLFSMLATHSFLALAEVKQQQGFGRRPLVVAINSLLVILGVTRALFMFLDPYESGENGLHCPHWLVTLFYGIAFPCLTSSFSLIHLAFLEVANVHIGPSKLQSVPFLGGVITSHFVLVIIAETTTATNAKLTPLLIVCQSFFILWGFLLSVSFTYSGLKVILSSEKVQRQLEMIETGAARQTASEKRRKTKTIKVAKVTFATSILGFACCGLQLYSLFGVYSLYSKAVDPSPWPWWIFQTCFRLVEFCMACTIAYSVMQRSKPAVTSKRHMSNHTIE
ncbi:proline-rich transmembrane protein 4-like [Orbicella faveolata]|uniref:proline-rich transmembrane protein 4-like n=1 Tax=Orbicella faveolata TaxID=48498 RepID=UPI0009E2B471|nr:proline-rich transmembrane protein 4-like [Orbicella faveolata]